MPQIIIDPANRGTLVEATPVASIPAKARAFRYVPNFRECLPGDLILFRDVTPNIFGQAIAAAQLPSHGLENAQWTHAAVFLYDDLVAEAVPFFGVRTRSLYLDIPGRILRVRRKQGLGVEDRYKIALRALRMLNSRYSFGAALSIGWRSMGFSTRLGAPTFGPVIICSKVYYDAYVEITRTLLPGCSIDAPVTPADLSATVGLEDIAVPWLALT
jgi:hypothetical protein